jgi:hypothetical protein
MMKCAGKGQRLKSLKDNDSTGVEDTEVSLNTRFAGDGKLGLDRAPLTVSLYRDQTYPDSVPGRKKQTIPPAPVIVFLE